MPTLMTAGSSISARVGQTQYRRAEVELCIMDQFAIMKTIMTRASVN